MSINRQWLLAQRPSGMVGPHNFEYAETPIPEPKNDEVLVKNLFLSFDPAQRNWMVDRKAYLPPVAIGAPMRAGSVGQVVDSTRRLPSGGPRTNHWLLARLCRRSPR